MSSAVKRRANRRRARSSKGAHRDATRSESAQANYARQAEARDRWLADALWRGDRASLELMVTPAQAELLLTADFCGWVLDELWEEAWDLARDDEIEPDDQGEALWDEDEALARLHARLRQLPQCPFPPSRALCCLAGWIDGPTAEAFARARFGWRTACR